MGELPATEARFVTTHWSLVAAAGETHSAESQSALAELCGAYWYPLYAWLRRSGRTPHDAQDLLQAFFARLLERKIYKAADQERGKFRTFLLTALKNFLADEHDRATAQKRGGDIPIVSLDQTVGEDRYRIELVDSTSPDRLFERKWALTLLENALTRLENEYAQSGRRALFTALQPHLLGDDDGETYTELGSRLAMSEGAVKVAMHRMRQGYRECLRTEVGKTVERWEDIDEEVRRLFAALAS